MRQSTNRFGQPVGHALPDWQPPPPPQRETLRGHFCRLEPLDAGQHAYGLHAANQAGDDAPSWTYMPYGPFESGDAYADWIVRNGQSDDPLFYAIVNAATDTPLGVASYLNINPDQGSIEVGHIHYADALKQTRAATEAMALMMAHAFALGYRRYEWKCDALNAASRRAAQRLGFRFEGVFRQATVYKQRNRDTAWYSVTDGEWPRLRAAFAAWLDSDNFDAEGRQQQTLSTLTQSPEAGSPKMTQFTTRPITNTDYDDWKPLFYGYAEFYKTAMNDTIADTVWRWLCDETHVLNGLLTRDSQGAAVAMAHIRACPRSLAGGEIGFLDDMFVLPEARGCGAADALFAALQECAAERAWPAIRWVTQHFNERGRGFYDKYTDGPSDFVMYHWPVA